MVVWIIRALDFAYRPILLDKFLISLFKTYSNRIYCLITLLHGVRAVWTRHCLLPNGLGRGWRSPTNVLCVEPSRWCLRSGRRQTDSGRWRLHWGAGMGWLDSVATRWADWHVTKECKRQANSTLSTGMDGYSEMKVALLTVLLMEFLCDLTSS